MVNAGELAEVVNADQVNLTNATDSLTFGQLYNITWRSLYPIHKRTRTDKLRETYVGLPDIQIEGDILITQPEITTFVTYHSLSGGTLPEKNWDFEITSKDTTADKVRIVAMMTGLNMIAGETGGAIFHVQFTTVTGVISEP